MRALIATLALLVACSSGSAPDAAPRPKPLEPMTVGYQGMINPWKAAIADGSIEAMVPGPIQWKRFSSGSEVITALASGDLDVAVAGSSPIATALARGLDLQLVWVLDAIDTAEALVARQDAGVAALADLKGKRVGVPFASTTHYHLLVALEREGVEPKELTILNLQPDAMAAAWQQGQIDAAFVWSPVLDTLRQDGVTLVTSGELAAAGKPTFDGVVVREAFLRAEGERVRELIARVAQADAAWRDEGGSWDASTPQVQAIAKLTGAPADKVVPVLKQYRFPTPAEQGSEAWLGGANPGAAVALQDTSAFLAGEGKVPAPIADARPFVTDAYVPTGPAAP